MPTGLERQGAVQNNTLRHARFPRPKFDKPKLSKTRALFKSDEMTLNQTRSNAFIYVTEKNRWLYFFALERPYRLAVRTPPFHGGGTGSIPVRVAIFS